MDHFLNSLFLKSTKESAPNNANLKNNVPAQIKLRELGSLRKIPGPTKELQLAAEDSLIDVSRVYTESVCDIPNSARSTFLMVFSSDSKLVASTHGDHNIYITELSSGKLISTLQGHPRTPWCIAFHPTSNEVLASGCLGGQVRVWDLHGGSELWVAQSQTVIASLAFHPVHRILAIASYNEIYFWDWSTEKAFAKSITGNDKEKVRYVAFDEGGSKLITGIANMSGSKRTEWDRVWSSTGFSRSNYVVNNNSNNSGNNSVPPPPPPPPPPSDTRITTFCYRYMLARYEQLMRRYRELSGRNPSISSSNNSNEAAGSEPNRSRDVSAGTDEITASLSSMARHTSSNNSNVHLLRRRSVGSSANTISPETGPSTSTHETSTETAVPPTGWTDSSLRSSPNSYVNFILRRQSNTRNLTLSVAPNPQSSNDSVQDTLTESPGLQSNPSAFTTLFRRNASSNNPPFSLSHSEPSLDTSSETIRPLMHLIDRRRRSVGSNYNSSAGGNTASGSASTLEPLAERSPSQSPAARRRRSVGSNVIGDRPSDDNERHPLQSRRIPIFGDQNRDAASAQPFSNNCRELLERVGELRTYIQTAWMQATRASDTDSDSSSTAIAQLANLMAEIPGGSRQRSWQLPDPVYRQPDEPSQSDMPPIGRLTEVLGAGLRRLRQINRQLRELEGDRDRDERDHSNTSLGVNSEYNSLRTMEQLLLRRIEEQEQQMESEVSRVRRFSNTLLTFDHDYASTPAGRFISATLEEALAEDSDSPGPTPSSPPHQSSNSDLEYPYARTLANNLVRERVERQLLERRISRIMGNCLTSGGSNQSLSMSSSPSIAGQATTTTSGSLNPPSNSGEGSSSRTAPDLASVRLGMQLLSRHIDNMSRLCRVRFEMVQLRQVRQMWDILQRSWVELQNAIEGSSSNNENNRFTEPSTSRDSSLPSTSRDAPQPSSSISSLLSLDLCLPSTSRDLCMPSTSIDLPESSPLRDVCLPSTSYEDLSQPSTSRSADTSSEMSDCTSPNQATPTASTRREISSVTPVTSSTSGVDSEGDGSSGSYSRPPLLSFRRSARTSASKRARFESAFRYFSRFNGGRGRSRSIRPYNDLGRPSAVPATDEASDEEESSSQPTPLSSHYQIPYIMSQNRRKRSFFPTLTTHEGSRGGRQYSGGRIARTGSSGSSGTPGRFLRHRSNCSVHRPPATTSTQTSTSRQQSSFYRSSNFRDFSSQTPPFLIDASVGTDPEVDESAEYGSAAGRHRARQALHQMIESLLDFLENDFTRNLPADALHRRIVCLYNLLQRALELTQTLIVQIMPLTARSSLGNSAISYMCSNVLSPVDHRRPPLRRSSTLSTTTSPPSSSSSGSESVRTIPSLQVNDAPMDETDLENSSNIIGRPRGSSSSRPPGPPGSAPSGVGRPPRWADLPPPGQPRILHISPVDDSTDDSSSSHVYIDQSFYIRCHSIGLTHRIQAWDFTDCQIPEISNAHKNVVVAECRVHNDASIDISKDGKLLVALLPSVSMGPVSNTNMLGIYSLEWSTLGQCLYRTVCLQNAVSVSLSPTSRHLIVGLTSKRSLMSLNIPQYLAQVCRLNGGEARVGGEKAGNLVLMRGIKLPFNSDTISVNCIRWVPQPGAGFVYGTNTGQLKILR